MLSSACYHPLQTPQINNEGNNGLIGDGSNNIVAVNSPVTIQVNDSENELNRLLDRYISRDALENSFYSTLECHPNTRTTVCNEIGQWIDESETEKSSLLWLNGPAGVGKSAIDKTISVSHKQEVVASFFSTSSDRSAITLFPTLAWQLGQKIPDTRGHIIASLKNSCSLQTSRIEEQFDLLILQPLKNITRLESRPVMVIDGVDECIDESILVRFLRVLVRTAGDGGMPVRFIICSRPEPQIRTLLGRALNFDPAADGEELKLPLSLLDKVQYLLCGPPVRHNSRSKPHQHQQGRGFLQDSLELYRPRRLGFDKHSPSSFDTPSELADTFDIVCPHPVVSTIQIGFSEECKQDIAKYLTDRFNAIPRPRDDTDPWFQPSDISDLVESSCGKFLYASTIARLLDEPHIDPRDVLEMARRGSLPTPDLNKLYKVILKRAQDSIRNQAQDGGPGYQMEWQFVMDSLIMLVFFAEDVHSFTVSNTFPIVECLLGLESGKLTRKLSKMHSVLSIDPGLSIRIHHRSFLEFLQNRERSGEYHIPISTALRRILILLGRVGLRNYSLKNLTDRRMRYIKGMAHEYRQNFFRQSRSPVPQESLCFNISYALETAVFVLSCVIMMKIIIVRNHMLSIVWTYFCVLSSHILSLCGSFIFSLKVYMLSSDRSVILPFFHPFIHPIFILTDAFLVFSKLFLVILFLTIAGVLPITLVK